jgi:uncharacterized membrane protein (DUF106 family)
MSEELDEGEYVAISKKDIKFFAWGTTLLVGSGIWLGIQQSTISKISEQIILDQQSIKIVEKEIGSMKEEFSAMRANHAAAQNSLNRIENAVEKMANK